MQPHLHLPNLTPRVIALRLHAALGASLDAEVEVSTPEPLDGEALTGSPVRLELHADDGEITAFHGVVAALTLTATANPDAQRLATLHIRSATEFLTLRQNARIFREQTAVDIVREVLRGGGIDGEAFVSEVGEPPPVRAHVTQWNETDATFLRRICEEEGLFFRFDPKDGFDAFVLCDRSSAGPEVLAAPLPFVDASGLRAGPRVAYHAREVRRRRVGRVAVRDYDPAHPAVLLEGKAEAGLDVEKRSEVFEAPARFLSESAGNRAARLRLESLRADAALLQFDTTALALRPGVVLEADPTLAVGPAPSGKYFVVETRFSWRAGEADAPLAVTAIPLDIPYRLPRTVPHPRIPGFLSATVTGAPGEEIHTDEGAHVRVRFHWDRGGPSDEKASLPVRVMMPNLPGSMLIPRVGWEVLVGFEDGDPDRPYVLGRSFNGRQLPPFSLPANKTITALGTVSSPGGGRANVVHMDDGAGRQHLSWSAGFGKTTDVGADMLNQTVGFDNTHVLGSQVWDVGGDQTVSVQNAWSVGVGSQTAVVSGNQTLTVLATGSTTVGSETVSVGATLLEKVGNPVSGLAEFAKAAALAGVGEIPVVGAALTKGHSWGNALYQGYEKGGLGGLAQAAGQTLTGELAGKIPGGDAIVAAADGAGLTPWSEKAQARAAEQAEGGGGGGAGAAGAGAAAAAPGHRKLVVDGAVTEVIGAVHAIQTPGSLKWTTLGASTFAIGGSHATAAVRISRLTLAASADTAAVTSVTASASIGRNVKAAHTLKAGGALKLDAGGEVGIQASGSLTVQAGGAISLDGGTVVFEVGGSSVSVHGGGVTLKSASITIQGDNTHSGKESTA